MNKKYVIQWKSKVNGRAGRGTKLFDLTEAQRLADELNTEYPDIEHQPVVATEPGQPHAEARPAGASEADSDSGPEHRSSSAKIPALSSR